MVVVHADLAWYNPQNITLNKSQQIKYHLKDSIRKKKTCPCEYHLHLKQEEYHQISPQNWSQMISSNSKKTSCQKKKIRNKQIFHKLNGVLVFQPPFLQWKSPTKKSVKFHIPQPYTSNFPIEKVFEPPKRVRFEVL